MSPLARQVETRSFLEEVLATKRQEVRALQSKPVPQRLRRSPVSLKAALKRPGPGFIFECKKTSPSLGNIRPLADVGAIIEPYRPFAVAVSVLTDHTYFNGSLADLEKAGQGTNHPLLAKDFFINERQIAHAHAAGADAILLMLSILNDRESQRLAVFAKGLSLEVLTEVHTAEEMARANALQADLIGINNRDLKTLRVNLETTDELAPLARKGTVLISESGFFGRSQILKAPAQVDGFLIGSSVMGAARPDLKIRELVFGPVKICGLTTKGDAKAAYDYGATYGGLNFVEGTPRAVSTKRAKEIIEAVPLRWTGVFRNATPSYCAALANYLGLEAVQLHGLETEQFRIALRQRLNPGIEIWQAVEGAKYNPRKPPKHCERVLLDAKKYQIFGGTGFSFGWARLKDFPAKDRLVLAGGINPANVANAVKTGIPILDICSGVEASRGRKSEEKIRALFQAIKELKRG